MLTWTLWCGLLFVLWIYFLWSRRRLYLLTLKIPGPLGYPFLGMAHKLIRREDILNQFGIYLAKHGPTIMSWLGPIPFVIASDPQVVQDILTSPHCVNKGIIYRAVDDGMGVGLFSLKDPRWSIHRKLLNPAFSHKVLLSFLPIFNKETGQLLNQLDELPSQGAYNLIPLLQNFTMGITTQTTMGCNVKSEENFKSIVECYHCCLETITDMCISPWLHFKWVRQLTGIETNYHRSKKEIRAFLKKLIQKRLSEDTEDSIQSKDKNIFLHVTMDLLKRGVFDRTNVEDESNQVVFGAFETTAKTVYYVLMLLAMYPQYQEKVFEEIESLFPNSGDFEVTYEDTQQMVYLDLVINESMRVIAPIPLVSRQTSDDLTLSNGVVIPKGVQIMIDIFHMHRSKKLWGPDAETFNPDNFLAYNSENHPYAFIPFTKGIRNCIGWRYALISVKVILAKMLRNYSFKTSFKFEDLFFIEDVTMKLKTVPKLQIQKRT